MNVASFPCFFFVVGGCADVVLVNSDLWTASANIHDGTNDLLTYTHASKALVTAPIITVLTLLENLALLIRAPRVRRPCGPVCHDCLDQRQLELTSFVSHDPARRVKLHQLVVAVEEYSIHTVDTPAEYRATVRNDLTISRWSPVLRFRYR